MQRTIATSQPVRDWPLYWFAELERSLATCNYERAAQAQRELRRLGVVVQFQGRERTGNVQ
jgi:hypothetical protein